jgi:hypothetical protein
MNIQHACDEIEAEVSCYLNPFINTEGILHIPGVHWAFRPVGYNYPCFMKTELEEMAKELVKRGWDKSRVYRNQLEVQSLGGNLKKFPRAWEWLTSRNLIREHERLEMLPR